MLTFATTRIADGQQQQTSCRSLTLQVITWGVQQQCAVCTAVLLCVLDTDGVQALACEQVQADVIMHETSQKVGVAHRTIPQPSAAISVESHQEWIHLAYRGQQHPSSASGWHLHKLMWTQVIPEEQPRALPAVAFDSSMASRPLPGAVRAFCTASSAPVSEPRRISLDRSSLSQPSNSKHKGGQGAAVAVPMMQAAATRDSRLSAAAPRHTCPRARSACGCGWARPSGAAQPPGRPRSSCSWRSASWRCVQVLKAAADTSVACKACKIKKGCTGLDATNLGGRHAVSR